MRKILENRASHCSFMKRDVIDIENINCVQIGKV